MRQLAVKRESTRAAAKATAMAMAVWWYGMFALCAQENWLALAKKDILQCVTKWVAKNTVPITIWGVPIWKGGGRLKISHLGTPRNHKVFVTIWGLTCIPHTGFRNSAM